MTLLLLLVSASCVASKPPKSLESEAVAQIYVAAIAEIHTFARTRSVVYVLTTTEDLVYDEAPLAPAQELASDLRETIKDELVEERFELVWIEALDQAAIDPSNRQIAEGEGIVITLGNIHPQEDGSVLLSFFMACGDLCGIGKTFVLNESGNNWHVTGSVGPEIAS